MAAIEGGVMNDDVEFLRCFRFVGCHGCTLAMTAEEENVAIQSFSAIVPNIE